MEEAAGLILFLALVGAFFGYVEVTRKPDAPKTQPK